MSTTYGDDNTFSNLATTHNNAVYSSDSGTYVFDLFEMDLSLNVDPSFAAQLAFSGFTEVSAVAQIDVSASKFNNFFSITTDSSDIDNVQSSDIKFSVESTFTYPFLDYGDVSLAFSNAQIKYGAINNQYADQSVKKDVVRNIAKSITGGYAVADIFSNEEELLNDVSNQDISMHNNFFQIITSVKDTGQSTVDAFASLSDDQARVLKTAQALFTVNATDDGGARQEALFADLSDASVDDNGDAKSETTVPLRFSVGDMIALRIQYDPNSSPVQGMGDNHVKSRSYKILLNLT